MYLLLFLASIPTFWSLIKPGFYYSHDGPFNLVRLIHFYEELQNGQFPVRIGTELARGFGYPVFDYFYPLTNYLGSLFHFIGFDFSSSIKLVIGLGSILSVFAFYAWARCHFGKIGSLAGAVFYLYLPYRLSAMYVIGSPGIVLSFLFAPLVLLSLHRVVIGKKRQYVVMLAFSLAGLVLSHNVSAMIFVPCFTIYTFYLLSIASKFANKLIQVMTGVVLGGGLAAFFVVPALADLKFVNLAGKIAVDYRDHFPTLRQILYSPWGYFFSNPGVDDGMSFQLGIAHWLAVLFASIGVAVFYFRKMMRQAWLGGIFLFIFFSTLFLSLRGSLPLWEILPVTKQIQFPWRLLSVLGLSAAFLGAFCVDKFGRGLLILLLVPLAMYGCRNYLRPMESVRYQESYYTSNSELFYGSTDIAWESLPVWAAKPPVEFALTPIKEVPGGAKYEVLPTKKGEIYRLNIESTEGGKVLLNIIYFPNWSVYIDGIKGTLLPEEVTGMAFFYVPSGNHKVVVKVEQTQIQIIANAISVVSLGICLYFIGHKKLFSR